VLIYNNLELVHPERREELINDLNSRYGILEIESIKVGKIDTVKNSARLQISFKDSGNTDFDDE